MYIAQPCIMKERTTKKGKKISENVVWQFSSTLVLRCVWCHTARTFSGDLGSGREDGQVPVGQMLGDLQPTVEGMNGDRYEQTEALTALVHAAVSGSYTGTSGTERTFTCSCTCRSAPWSVLCRSSLPPSASLSPAGSVPTWKPTTRTVKTTLHTQTPNNSTKSVLIILKFCIHSESNQNRKYLWRHWMINLSLRQSHDQLKLQAAFAGLSLVTTVCLPMTPTQCLPMSPNGKHQTLCGLTVRFSETSDETNHWFIFARQGNKVTVVGGCLCLLTLWCKKKQIPSNSKLLLLNECDERRK